MFQMMWYELCRLHTSNAENEAITYWPYGVYMCRIPVFKKDFECDKANGYISRTRISDNWRIPSDRGLGIHSLH